ncbi:amino acid permease 3-like [Oryza brachyantha]|uniref:amino acid permease 3-like n=1 Tax=Oryza brachyantha TaxID=4533 RepID=UPI001ADC7772|nr:amino acid permease 3-like [Oryza brachyantha]
MPPPPPEMDQVLKVGGGEDGQPRRTGTMWTASAHIITAVIGSGVLSLAWGVAQLGWVGGPAVMVLFGAVIYCCSVLLVECYRSGDPATGPRNRTYMDAVRASLGGFKVRLCGVLQFANFFGVCVGITIASSVSMLAVRRAGCFHVRGHDQREACGGSSRPYMLIYGGLQVVFSQIPDIHDMSWLSTLASIMSLSYSAIGIALGVAQIVANGEVRGTLTGVFVGAGAGVTSMQKVWRSFQAFGNIAFAYGFSFILLEIQDTVKAVPPPSTETKVMRKAVAVSVATTTVVYLMCGCVGYAAFGSESPDNLLTGFGFFEPFWLLDLANAGVVVHLVGTYQVVAQPVFAFLDRRAAAAAWPGSTALGRKRVVRVGSLSLTVSPFRLVWRTAFVCVTTAASTLLPFFGSMVGLIGAASFWPLTVYFPVEMFIAQRRVPRGSAQWVSLQALSAGCLVVSVAASAGSIAGVVEAFKAHNPLCWTC